MTHSSPLLNGGSAEPSIGKTVIEKKPESVPTAVTSSMASDVSVPSAD